MFQSAWDHRFSAKWKIFRSLCEAKPLLGLSDRALAVLNALLSFYPGNVLGSANGLVVFPSNVQLSIRPHGIAPATLRRHLAALVEAGLLLRKDSPNGKRFARRDGEGLVDQAYGFSISPLIARASEIRLLAAQVMADRELFRVTKEKLSLCRRDIAKLIEVAVAEGVAGDWMKVHHHFRGLVIKIPRSPTIDDIKPIIEEMEMLRQEVLNLLEHQANTVIIDGNESQNERHIQVSNTESNSVFEAAHEEEQGANSTISHGLSPVGHSLTHQKSESACGISSDLDRRKDRERERAATKAFPLGLVLQACPEILSYGPSGNVASWRDRIYSHTSE